MRKKKQMIERAAARYLNNESIRDIAPSLGITSNHLRNVLTKWSGTKYPLTLHSPLLNFGASFVLTMPELLPAETIENIHKRLKLNRTFNGEKKHHYLLSKFIFLNREDCIKIFWIFLPEKCSRLYLMIKNTKSDSTEIKRKKNGRNISNPDKK